MTDVSEVLASKPQTDHDAFVVPPAVDKPESTMTRRSWCIACFVVLLAGVGVGVGAGLGVNSHRSVSSPSPLATSPATAYPPPATSPIAAGGAYVVTASASLQGYTVSTFTTAAQTVFISTLAQSLGVLPSAVNITSVSAASTGRHLLQGGVVVAFTIQTTSNTTASTLSTALTATLTTTAFVQQLNSAFSAASLPQVSGVGVVQVPTVTASSSPPQAQQPSLAPSTSPPFPPDSLSPPPPMPPPAPSNFLFVVSGAKALAVPGVVAPTSVSSTPSGRRLILQSTGANNSSPTCPQNILSGLTTNLVASSGLFHSAVIGAFQVDLSYRQNNPVCGKVLQAFTQVLTSSFNPGAVYDVRALWDCFDKSKTLLLAAGASLQNLTDVCTCSGVQPFPPLPYLPTICSGFAVPSTVVTSSPLANLSLLSLNSNNVLSSALAVGTSLSTTDLYSNLALNVTVGIFVRSATQVTPPTIDGSYCPVYLVNRTTANPSCLYKQSNPNILPVSKINTNGGNTPGYGDDVQFDALGNVYFAIQNTTNANWTIFVQRTNLLTKQQTQVAVWPYGNMRYQVIASTGAVLLSGCPFASTWNAVNASCYTMLVYQNLTSVILANNKFNWCTLGSNNSTYLMGFPQGYYIAAGNTLVLLQPNATNPPPGVYLYEAGASALTPAAWLASNVTTGALAGVNNPPTYAGESIALGSGSQQLCQTSTSGAGVVSAQCGYTINQLARLENGVVVATYQSRILLQYSPFPKVLNFGPFALSNYQTSYVNVASPSFGASVTCSSSVDSTNVCSNVVDTLAVQTVGPSPDNGPVCYKPSPPAGTGLYFQNAGPGGWIQIDLGSVKTFNYVSVFGRGDASEYIPLSVYAGNSSDVGGANNVQLGVVSCISNCDSQTTPTLQLSYDSPALPGGTQFFASVPVANAPFPTIYARYINVLTAAGYSGSEPMGVCQVQVIAPPTATQSISGIIYVQPLRYDLAAVWGVVNKVYQTTIYNSTADAHIIIPETIGVKVSAFSSGADGAAYISGISASSVVLLKINLTTFAVTTVNMTGFQVPLASFAAF